MSKTKHTAKAPENQLSLFDLFDPQMTARDDRPLPLIIAEQHNFPLTHIDQTGETKDYIYLAQEWYLGLGGKKSAWSQYKTDWFTRSKPVMIEVKRERRKPEMMEFVTAEGLYFIAAQMTARDDRPLLNEIKIYLAHAGVKLDEYRLNPERAAHEQNKIADMRYAKRLKEFGYTEAQIPALLAERREDVEVRHQFTDTLHDTIEGAVQYGAITDAEYTGLFHRNAAQIGNQMDTKQVRENMHPIAKNFCKIAELTCIEKVRQLHRKLTSKEAYDMMYGIAMSLGVSVDWIQKQLGFDVVTGQPLFPKWNREKNMD